MYIAGIVKRVRQKRFPWLTIISAIRSNIFVQFSESFIRDLVRTIGSVAAKPISITNLRHRCRYIAPSDLNCLFNPGMFIWLSKFQLKSSVHRLRGTVLRLFKVPAIVRAWRFTETMPTQPIGFSTFVRLPFKLHRFLFGPRNGQRNGRRRSFWNASNKINNRLRSCIV